jgi:peroxin-16
LGLTKARPLVTPPLPAREIDPAALEELANPPNANIPADFPSPSFSSTSTSEDDPNHPYTLPRTGGTLPGLSSTSVASPLAQTDGITSYLFSRVLTVEDIKPAAQLLPRLNGLSWYAEILHILRPLLYALIMQRWVRKRGEQNAKQSWWPWLLGLSIEYASMELWKRENEKSYRSSLGKLEKGERNQRAKTMWWWALRGAMYEHVSKYVRFDSSMLTFRPIIDGFVKKVDSVPLLNVVGGVISDYQYLWENYYFSSLALVSTLLISSRVDVAGDLIRIWISLIGNQRQKYLIQRDMYKIKHSLLSSN